MANTVKKIAARPAIKETTTLNDKIWAMAKPAKVMNGKIILDRNDPSDREWYEDKKIGEIFK
jgi:hypothetical protein